MTLTATPPPSPPPALATAPSPPSSPPPPPSPQVPVSKACDRSSPTTSPRANVGRRPSHRGCLRIHLPALPSLPNTNLSSSATGARYCRRRGLLACGCRRWGATAAAGLDDGRIRCGRVPGRQIHGRRSQVAIRGARASKAWCAAAPSAAGASSRRRGGHPARGMHTLPAGWQWERYS